MRTVKILGVKINEINPAELKEEIKVFLNSGRPNFLATVNPEMLLKAHRDEVFKKILNQTNLSLPDGVGVILASRFLKKEIKGRLTGNDLIEIIAQTAVKKKKSIFLLGARGSVARRAGQTLLKKYSGLKIAGASNGTLAGQDLSDKELIQQINSAKPDILLVAFGAPKQEKWLFKNLPHLPSVKIGVGIGGAFDFLAGRVKRAPLFLRKIGLEWLWRLICQPWRIFRIFNAVFRFSWVIIKNKKYE